ncbi:MAG: DUF1820 family protein [Proteobacteria bacterium]|nr:DUF1820 family protein [Pseudomonadota bacterium]
MPEKHTYRITFHNQGKVYEIYAQSVHQSGLFGFIEVEQIVFGAKSSVVVDPSEEHLKTEFEGVTRTYLPMHAIIRIDEVEKTGHSKITDGDERSNNVTPFPVFTPGQGTTKS